MPWFGLSSIDGATNIQIYAKKQESRAVKPVIKKICNELIVDSCNNIITRKNNCAELQKRTPLKNYFLGSYAVGEPLTAKIREEVGEIFTEAGAAFNKLAEMTMLLHPMAEHQTSSQSKTPIKKKVQEERMTPVSSSSGQVTLNMLNAAENEMDVEVLGNDVKLEFESSTEEVPT